MRRIRVIAGGCGIRYKDSAGNRRHALKTPSDGAFLCDDEQAGRLVKLGVARYEEEIPEKAEKMPEKQEETGEAAEEATAEPAAAEEAAAEPVKKAAAAKKAVSAAKKTAPTAKKGTAKKSPAPDEDEETAPVIRAAAPEV